MESRGKRIVKLAIANATITQNPENELSESEGSVLFSSDSDEDPTYYPDADIEFGRPRNMELEADITNSAESFTPTEQTDEFLLENRNFVQNPTVSSSGENRQLSPIIEVSPTVICNFQEARSTDATIPQDTESEIEVLPGCSNSLSKGKTSLRKPDYCYFCESDVQNFARHIQRNHSQELEVIKISSLPQKSIERKRLIATLRKKGNFLKNSESLFKPVHKSILNNCESNYVPCPFCLGMYSRKLLWKHKKICPENKNPGTRITLSEGQNLLLPKLNVVSDLKLKVFPRMMADQVSLTAKKDSLICAFGTRYLKTHRERHHVHVCSRKMRELAKVLIESQNLNAKIKNVFDLLQPQYFDLVVNAVKAIAKYDCQKDIYLSPTFAMNISRSLKDCCDIAILHIVKRKYNDNSISAAEAEANVTLFVRLLESTWKHEISSQAGNDLNTKTWNKITLIPLAVDLKLFRKYLIDKGNEAQQKLKENMKDLKNFNLLMETVFCRLLLLNRKRVGELQRMKLATYMLSEENKAQNYEEFAEAITPTEKILLKSFKRVVIRGKRGRGVPVLFSKDMQDHVQLLLQARPHSVQQKNLFLFANPKSEQPIVGYKVLQKHAHSCGAKNPQALTSTKLRKHLATLTQVFNMTSNDIEQLATFMGHTVNVHSKVYRLPDDVFQTAKIAKLLMLMERGDAAKFKGKTLEEIDLDMDQEIGGEFQENSENVTDNIQNMPSHSGNVLDVGDDILEAQNGAEEEVSIQQPNKSKMNKKRLLIPWTTDQKSVVLQFFKQHIKSKKPPKRGECEILIKKHPDLLENKSWLKIKVFIQNQYTKKSRHDSDDD